MHRDSERAEAIQAEVWTDLFAAAPPGFASAMGLASRSFGGLAAFALRAAPSKVFNRVQRTGPPDPPEGDIAAAVAWMRGNAASNWALQLPEGTPERPEELARLGLEPTGSWTVFAQGTGHVPAASTSLAVEVAGPERAADFGSTVQAGFGMPPAFAEWMAALAGRPGWTAYLATRDGTPAAAAALYLSGGTGWVGLGCCLPEHRRQGAQSALLARRIADAAAAGAGTVVTETGTPPPGELVDHPSFRNISRAGFEPLYRLVNWQPAAG